MGSCVSDWLLPHPDADRGRGRGDCAQKVTRSHAAVFPIWPRWGVGVSDPLAVSSFVQYLLRLVRPPGNSPVALCRAAWPLCSCTTFQPHHWTPDHSDSAPSRTRITAGDNEARFGHPVSVSGFRRGGDVTP